MIAIGGCTHTPPVTTDLLECTRAATAVVAPFRTLSVGDGIAEVCVVGGRPLEDIGSGIHIYRYAVPDGDVLVGVMSDAVMYVDHVSPSGTERLCGPPRS